MVLVLRVVLRNLKNRDIIGCDCVEKIIDILPAEPGRP